MSLSKIGISKCVADNNKKKIKSHISSTIENSENGDSKCNKDKTIYLSDIKRKATRSVILIASIYIVCYLPSNIVQICMSAIPNCNKGMPNEKKKLFEVCWSFTHTVEVIRSRCNITVYMKSSTKFKEAFFARFKFVRK